MNDKHLLHFEAQLERLIEGVFSGLFRRRLNAHDIALKLARGMESSLRTARDEDSRPIAPDQYTVALHPDSYRQLTRSRPDMPDQLAQHLVELASQSGYRLVKPPTVRLLSSPIISVDDIDVQAEHSEETSAGTAAMQPVRLATEPLRPQNPQLVINGERIVPLDQSIVNIGRGDNNDIVVFDSYVSRHHVQLRLRGGTYMLFDVQSKSGTLVNNVAVTEHRLQPGDVIQIGSTRMVYTTELPSDAPDNSHTDIFNRTDFL
jgi:pSer/pThr/pTyr-binding forkhead associated (FHA) protein